eukprot:7205568-Prymnesium_polylepis.2
MWKAKRQNEEANKHAFAVVLRCRALARSELRSARSSASASPWSTIMSGLASVGCGTPERLSDRLRPGHHAMLHKRLCWSLTMRWRRPKALARPQLVAMRQVCNVFPRL